ncbi:hypothetical protein MPTK1_3g15230 [Marchantia polymorpha subsp. ruderalis]|uniref:Rx N-terminal domain-containing protein n=2 Tax=Marchantia polymorpha TaxID=3197 RepID=A0AAF6B111_MARPO|nr:hypothetical protein MARPO_0004s0149 [Marchantia polymorpha]BBN05695.1 hypothetical protein Mp_3g15230 [Marchantia polymorpha subsp. ruderalis]|eukprot:PTQ48887.1 hypothetical protein MARPO_0004s0149 [Marchantia polymorpha]
MAEAVFIMGLGLVGKAVKNLVLTLLDVKETKQHSKIICKEIDLFVKTLNENIKLLKVNLPASVSRRALGALSLSFCFRFRLLRSNGGPSDRSCFGVMATPATPTNMGLVKEMGT